MSEKTYYTAHEVAKFLGYKRTVCFKTSAEKAIKQSKENLAKKFWELRIKEPLGRTVIFPKPIVDSTLKETGLA